MISNRIKQDYKKLRASGYAAKSALYSARINSEWRAFECGNDEPEFGIFCVRLQIIPDDCCDMDNLKGDTYNRKANPDIQESRMAREEKEFEERVDRDGVWGVVGEFWNGSKWTQADSCFGFVGDDWKGSGYDDDIKRATLDAYNDFVRVSELEPEMEAMA